MKTQIKTKHKLQINYSCLSTNNCNLNKFYCNHICRDFKYDTLSVSNNFDNIMYNIKVKDLPLTESIQHIIFNNISLYNNVSGRLIDNNNNPVPQCVINLSKQNNKIYQTISDDNGFFIFSNILYGKYYIICEDSQYEHLISYCEVFNDIKYLTINLTKK